MSKLMIQPQEQEIEVSPGLSLVEVCEDRDLGVFFGCRQGACGSCLIAVCPRSRAGLSAPTEDERVFLDSLGATEDQRLACQCSVIGDVAISADPDHVFAAGRATEEGFLFLSHRGLSFVDDLMAKASALGMKSYVLSSLPSEETPGRAAALIAAADWCRVTPSDSLLLDDVLAAIRDLEAQGKRIVGCVSVWEGYRSWMAEANHALGAPDEAPERIARILDKHELRSRLYAAGLSHVRSELIEDEASFDRVLRASGKRFVKPRRGLASFGAFRLTDKITYARLQALSQEMRSDTDYREIFTGKGAQFIAEDYIGGVEMSFEVIAREGAVRVVAIHEKVEVDEAGETTLETSCVSPPVSADRAALEEGECFIGACFAELGLRTGCYHVEAKLDPRSGRWEIIEINPRVGGAFINASTAAQLGGPCLLELWLETFLPGRALPSNDPTRPIEETFFRVYFGEPGREIARVDRSDGDRAPATLRMMVSPGARLPKSSREIFLAQALWRGRPGELTRNVQEMIRISKEAIRFQYQPVTV